MRSVGVILLGFIGVWAPACSDSPRVEAASDISGRWCGRAVATPAECLGDEVGFVELSQASDGSVTGTWCEEYGADECYALEGGRYADGRFTFFYTFSTFRVDGAFSSDSATTLSGALTSNKCACEIPQEWTRIP